MKKLYYLLIAIFGNAFGTALMNNTALGMTAWGGCAKNVSNLLHVSIGLGFIIVSVLFYLIAIFIKRKFIMKPFIESFLFLFGYALFSDIFILVIPDFSSLLFMERLIINIIGLLVLLFSISLHLKLQIAVHPLDVYLYELQVVLKDVRKGTYIAYFSAFFIAIISGLLYGEIEGIGIGTIIALTTSGVIMHFYNKFLFKKVTFHSIKEQ